MRFQTISMIGRNEVGFRMFLIDFGGKSARQSRQKSRESSWGIVNRTTNPSKSFRSPYRAPIPPKSRLTRISQTHFSHITLQQVGLVAPWGLGSRFDAEVILAAAKIVLWAGFRRSRPQYCLFFRDKTQIPRIMGSPKNITKSKISKFQKSQNSHVRYSDSIPRQHIWRNPLPLGLTYR